MLKLKGADFANCNGKIDYEKVARQLDFVILRAGYGKNNIDQSFYHNANGFKGLLPMHYYWFSYAYTVQMAKNEAQYCLDQVKKYTAANTGCKIAFDFEYDSVNYALKKGVPISKALAMQMVLAFCNVVKNSGYIAVVYTNKDFANRYFNLEELKKHKIEIWYAYYNKECNRNDVELWQYTSSGRLDGVATNVDLDILYKQEEATITGWILDREEKRWWYCHEDGSYTKDGWELIENKWYYFDKNGWMLTGWLETKDGWYYLKEDGSMAADERLIIKSNLYGEETYCFGNDGHMLFSNSRGALV